MVPLSKNHGTDRNEPFSLRLSPGRAEDVPTVGIFRTGFRNLHDGRARGKFLVVHGPVLAHLNW